MNKKGRISNTPAALRIVKCNGLYSLQVPYPSLVLRPVSPDRTFHLLPKFINYSIK